MVMKVTLREIGQMHVLGPIWALDETGRYWYSDWRPLDGPTLYCGVDRSAQGWTRAVPSKVPLMAQRMALGLVEGCVLGEPFEYEHVGA